MVDLCHLYGIAVAFDVVYNHAGGFDGEMHAFVRVNAPKEDQITAARLPERIQREIDAIVDGGEVIQPGRAIGFADGNEIPIAIFFVHRHDPRG